MSGQRNSNRKENLTIIFLHIPKAAGITIYSILKNQYAPGETYQIDGNRTPESIKEFLNLPAEKKKKIRILQGHMSFGLHRQFSGETTYFTLLRDPLERIISHYYYVLRSPEHYLYEKVTKGKISLKDFVTGSTAKELNDGQVRFISGVGFYFGYNQCPYALLELAQSILDKFFTVVGVNEYFDETVLLLKKSFNWKPPVYIRQNVTENRPRQEDLDNDTVEAIKEYNKLDIALYRYAQENFKTRISALGSSFQAELRAFKILNDHWRHFWNVDKIKEKMQRTFNKHIINDLIKRIEALIAQGDTEAALYLARDAVELYPREKKFAAVLNSLPG